MEAVYRLHNSPASFNFVEFLVAAKTLGATEIVLDDTKGYSPKFSPEETARRMKSIVEPACVLAEVAFRYGEPKTQNPINCGYGLHAPMKAFKKTGSIAKLKAVKPRACEATVTLRNQPRHEHRNSNREAWLRLAKEVGAVVIEDYSDAPISLSDRMALYAGAKMNYFSSNGPSVLCFFSDYPYTAIIPRVESDAFDQTKNPLGKFPWATDKQRVWVMPDSWQFLSKLLVKTDANGVTEEMVDAGIVSLSQLEQNNWLPGRREAVTNIYLAMKAAQK